MSIAYVPLDILTTLPNEDDVINFSKTYGQTMGKCWLNTVVYSSIPLNIWEDRDKFNYILDNNIDLGHDPEYFYNFDKIFPEIAGIIEQLPYKKIKYACLFQQIKEVAPHNDETRYIENASSNPYKNLKRINIFLTKHHYKSFYMYGNGTKQHISIPKTRSVFAFNDEEYEHGADWAGEDKCLLVTNGELDNDIHQKLVEQSIEKFNNEVLYYE